MTIYFGSIAPKMFYVTWALNWCSIEQSETQWVFVVMLNLNKNASASVKFQFKTMNFLQISAFLVIFLVKSQECLNNNIKNDTGRARVPKKKFANFGTWAKLWGGGVREILINFFSLIRTFYWKGGVGHKEMS